MIFYQNALHLTRVHYATFYLSALRHEKFEDVTTEVTPPSRFLFRVDFIGYILLWFTCKTTRRRSCLTFTALA